MSRRHPVPDRAAAVERLRSQLVRDSFPRLQMLLLVALTGGFGLLASFCLLRLGLDAMAVRYPLALGVAYLFFLGLIWLWLRTRASDILDASDLVDLADLSDVVPGRATGGGDGPVFRSGGGGQFGGGGATGSFDGKPVPMPVVAPPPSSAGVGSGIGDVGDTVASLGDADEWTVPLVVIALAVGLALASLYVVYIAPVLFAEVLVDGALSYALFRHLRRQSPRHWLASTFRRTVVPFVVTAVFLVIVGGAMSAYAPGAVSIGQVVGHATRRAAAP